MTQFQNNNDIPENELQPTEPAPAENMATEQPAETAAPDQTAPAPQELPNEWKTEEPSGLDWRRGIVPGDSNYMPGITPQEALRRDELADKLEEDPKLYGRYQKAYSRGDRLHRIREQLRQEKNPTPLVETSQEGTKKDGTGVEAPKTKEGLSIAEKGEAAELERAYNKNLAMFANGAFGSNPELFANEDRKIAEVSPGAVLERAGWTDEQLDEHRRRWYTRQGYALPEETRDLYTGVAADPERKRRAEEYRNEQAREARNIYAAFGMGVYDNSEEDIKQYLASNLGPDENLDQYMRELQIGSFRKAYYDAYGEEMPDSLIEKIPTQGLLSGETLAGMANSRTHADILLANELSARQYYYDPTRFLKRGEKASFAGLEKDMQENPDKYDLHERATGNFFSSTMGGFSLIAKTTPGALAQAGISIYKLSGKISEILPVPLSLAGSVGMSEYMSTMDDYVETTAQYHATLHAAHQYVNDKEIQAYLAENPNYLKENPFFNAKLRQEAGTLSGMLLADIVTSLFTAKVPGLTTAMLKALPKAAVGQVAVRQAQKPSFDIVKKLAASAKQSRVSSAGNGITDTLVDLSDVKAAVSATARGARAAVGPRGTTAQAAAGRVAAPLVDTTAAREAAAIIARGAEPIVQPAKSVAGFMGKIAGKEITHGPNTFLARVYGESYGNSWARQVERAKADGREPNELDFYYALQDGVASTAIAYLIGKNIPKFGRTGAKIPTQGKGSNGLYSILGSRGFAPETLAAAKARAGAKFFLGQARSGADFAAFNILTDAYMLASDSEDRANVLMRYIDNTSDQVKHLFGQFLLGMPLGIGRGVGGARNEIQRFSEFKEGYAAYKYLRSLPSQKRQEILDTLTDAQVQGAARRMQQEKAFVAENPELMKDFKTESLMEILWFGDRQVPDVQLSTTQHLGGEVRARLEISGERVKGRLSRELVNESGQVEVTRNMAMAELQKRGVTGPLAMFEGQKINSLFLTRAEYKARRQQSANELQRQITQVPPSPKPAQVTPVQGFVKALRFALGDQNARTNREVFNGLNTKEARRVVNTAINSALADAKRDVSGNRVKRLNQAKKLAGQPNFRKLADAGLAPYISAALRTHKHIGIKPAATSTSPGRSMIDRIVTSNKPLVRHVARAVVLGKNTPQQPAISRAQMQRLSNGKITPSMNTKANRYRLAKLIEAQSNEKLQEVNLRPARSEVMARKPERTTLPLEQASSTAQIKRSFAEPIKIDAVDIANRQKEAEQAGAKSLLEPIDVAASEARQRAKSSDPKPIVDTLVRLMSNSEITQGVKQVPPIKSQGGIVHQGELNQRVASVVRHGRDQYGLKSVEVDFAENVVSAHAESTFALGRAFGYSVVVGHGGNKGMPAIVDMGQGVLLVNSSAPIAQIRTQIATRGSTLQWAASLPKSENPINWLHQLIKNPENLAATRKAWEAHLEAGSDVAVKPEAVAFSQSLLMSRRTIGESASLFETIFNYLPKEQQRQIIAMRPKEMANWFAYTKEGLEAVGHKGKTKRHTVLGTRKPTDRVLEVAEGKVSPITSRGTVRASLITTIQGGAERKFELQATARDHVSRFASEREVLVDKIENATNQKLENKGDQAAAHQAEVTGIELFGGAAKNQKQKAILENIRRLEERYPGFWELATSRLKRSGFKYEPVAFEHMGKIFVIEPRTANGKTVPRRVTIRDKEFETTGGVAREATMTPEQRATSDSIKEVVVRGEERAGVPLREVERDLAKEEKAENQPPEPPKTPEQAAGEKEPPPPGEVRLTAEEGKPETQTSKKGMLAQTLQFVMDPLNLSILSGDKPFQKLVEKVISTEARIENERNETLDTIRRIHREIDKDKSSTLLKGDNFVAIMEAKIAPTKEAMRRHELTKNLSEKEMEYVAEHRRVFEEHRQEHIAHKRELVEMGYRHQPNMNKVAEMANGAKPELEAKVIREKGTNRKFIEVKDGMERVRYDKERFVKFMSETLVPETYGYKFSYFPHLFFGSYRGELITYRDGVKVGVQKFGSGEKKNTAAEREGVIEAINKEVEMQRLAERSEGRQESGLSFEVKMKEAGGRMPSESVYLPTHMRRRLVNAIRQETGAYTNEINQALRGKVSSQPVATRFNQAMLRREGTKNYSKDVSRVMEVAIANHYKNKLSRELQKETRELMGTIDKNSPEWIGKQSRELMRHTVFGTRGHTVEMVRKLAGDREVMGMRLADAAENAFSGLRTFQFYRQLMRPAQHIINSTQALQIWSLLGTKGFLEARKEYNSDKGKQFLKDWGSFELNGRYDKGKFGDSLGNRGLIVQEKIHSALNKVSGKVWNANSEARNQNFAFFALAKHARDRLGLEPQAAAEYGLIWGQHFTQYRFQKANEAAILRGSAMKTLMQFKRFQIQTLGMASSLLTNSRGGNVIEGLPSGAFTRFMILNTLLGGARGSLLGASYFLVAATAGGAFSALKDAVDPENVSGMGSGFSSQEDAMKWLSTKMDTNIAEAIMFGGGSLFGLDTSGNFSLTNIGGDGLLGYFFGPSFGMFKDLYDVRNREDFLARPDFTRYAEVGIESGAATRSVKGALELLMFWGQFDKEKKSQEYMDTVVGIFGPQARQAGTGQIIEYKSLWDQVARTLGFRSKGDTLAFMEHARMQDLGERYNKARKKIATMYTQNPDTANDMMIEWNAKYGTLLPIYMSDLRDMVERVKDAQTIELRERREETLPTRLKDRRGEL